MRIFAFVASVVIGSTFLAMQSTTAAAESSQDQRSTSEINTSELDESELAKLLQTEKSSVLATLLQSEDDAESVLRDAADEDAEVEIEPVEHEVERGETLISIAEEYDVDWLRIWAKNNQLNHPDKLSIDDTLVIPFEDEELEERDLPEPEPVQAPESTEQSASSASSEAQPRAPEQTASTQQQQPRGSSSGNLYVAGYCTWYAKNRRPDLPNNLGNANTWVSRARAQGIPTGSEPRVGAIGQQGMHVVYVEAVHSDGTVTISEMNWHGLHVISERRVAASNFQYIY